MTSLALIPYDDAHLGAMGDLWVASWALTMPDIDFEARRPWLVDHLAKLRADGAEIHLVRSEGAIAGFVVIAPATGYLDQLAVGPAFLGKGVADALMEKAKARSSHLVALDVNQDNPRAVRFYEKQGLKIVAEGENPMSGRKTYRMEWRPEGA